jgi:hypothetical protein
MRKRSPMRSPAVYGEGVHRHGGFAHIVIGYDQIGVSAPIAANLLLTYVARKAGDDDLAFDLELELDELEEAL